MSSGSKRKRDDRPNMGDFLHPGEWRNTPKRSKSPLASGASTANAGYSYSPSPSNSSFGKSTGDAWTGLEQALRSLRLTTKICPSLSLATEELVSCLPIFEAAAKGHRDDNALATTGLKNMVDQLIPHLNETTPKSIIDIINDIAEVIRKEIEPITMHQSHSLLRRLLGASTVENDLIRSYRRIEQLFLQLQGEVNMGGWNTVNELRLVQQLGILHPSNLAMFNSMLSTEVNRRGCTKDTRTMILEEAIAWSENPDVAKIYWMNGMAGTGKTTIAYSLCERLDAGKQLAASFFCTRASPECREAKRIIPTIAYQLARRFAPFRYSLCNQLTQDPDITAGQLSDQFDLLLKKPLLAAKDQLSNNLVIVVDALDECSDPHIVELFLDLLFRSVLELPIKFFVTSRPEPAIRNIMMPESEQSRSILYLHEIELSLVQADIELYLKEELASIAPADEDLAELAEHAGNLFIYAATAVRYIRPVGKAVNSKARLRSILAVGIESNTTLSAIDALYTAILATAINDEELTPEERKQIHLVLQTAVCACEPILIRTLSALSGLNDKDDTTAALQPLRSVLYVSDHSDLVTTLHESFRSYMFDQARSGAFHCDKVAHSQFLAERCLRIMEDQLRFNVCSIRSSFIPNDKISELEEQIKNNISDELSYACRFWVDHLSETHHTDSLLLLLTYEFLSQRLLFWIEVLSLKSYMVVGVTMLTKLNSWLSQPHLNTHVNLLELASDAQGFLATYAFGPASAYVSHIYLSMLPLSPPSSCVRSQYLSQFKGLVNVYETTFDRVGKAPFSTWVSTGSSRCAAFSPNGGRVFLGDEKGKISVQSSYTGECIIPPFMAHKQAITSLGVSSDGMQIVSGSHDMTLSIWNAHTGSLLSGPFKGHSDRVTSVAFSPGAMLVVSGSDDCTVSIWNANSVAAPMRSLRGHQKAVNSVAFSPDGTRVISGSSDCTFRLWNIFNGDTIFIKGDHGGAVTAVQFTPNDFYIISGCGDNIIRVWNARDGTLFCQSQNAHSGGITSIAVSLDGCRIVSGSWDCTLCVWDTQTCDLISGPFEGHTEPIKCVGFSGDGVRTMSASDKTVRVWDLQQRKPQTEKASITDGVSRLKLTVSRSQAHVAIWDNNSHTETHVWDLRTTTHVIIPTSADIELLLFSLDGARIYLLHTSGTICTWDTQTGKLLDGPYRFTSFEKWDSVACSSDGTRIVTCYKDKVELWHVKSDRSIAVCETGCDLPRVIFSQDGSRFATSSGYSSNVWDGEDGTHVAGPLSVRAFDISPDGTYLCCWSNRFQLMNINTGETIDMQAGYVWNLVFTPDGLHIAVRQDSRTIDVFNTCGQKVNSFELQDPSSYISNLLGYSSDGWILLLSQRLSGEVKNIYVRRVHVDNPPFTIDPDGWVLDNQQRPLLWVPEKIRSNFPGYGGLIISDTKEVLQSVDYGGMFVGDNWSQCYTHDSQ